MGCGVMNKRKYKSNGAYLLKLRQTDNDQFFQFDIVVKPKTLESPMGRPHQDESIQIITDTQLNYETGMKVMFKTENKSRIITKVDPKPIYQKGMGKTIYDYIIDLT
jgi:hypothetical protein